MTRDELGKERFAHTTPPPRRRRADDEPSTGLHLTVIEQPDPLTPWVAHLEAPDGQRLRRPVETVWIPGVSGDRE